MRGPILLQLVSLRDVGTPVGSIAKCESPTFAGACPSETPLARTYRQLDLDARRTLFRLTEARRPIGEIAERLSCHPSTMQVRGVIETDGTRAPAHGTAPTLRIGPGRRGIFCLRQTISEPSTLLGQKS